MIQRLSLIAGWLALAFIAFATLSPIAERPAMAGPQLEHFVAFAAMGCAFAMGYPKRTLIFIVLVIASAFGLEALQLLTPDRHGRFIDAAQGSRRNLRGRRRSPCPSPVGATG
jgi:hypothetical protein